MVLSSQPNNRINRNNRTNRKPSKTEKTVERELSEIVASAREAKDGYVRSLLLAYRRRQQWRESKNIPVIAICGYGGSGKDLSAAYLCSRTSLGYSGSISSVIAPLIAHSMGVSVEQAFQTRRENRVFWYDFFCELRRTDPTLLAKMNLAHGDMVVGPRDDTELFACRREKVVNFSVWLSRPNLPVEETVKFGPEDCDVTLHNCGSKFELFRKWDSLLNLMPRFPSFTV